jgi:hypothetical protein
MQRLTIFLLTISLLALFTNFAWSGGPADITNPQKIAALTDISEKLGIVSTAVTNCMSAGKDHNNCMCENEKSILNFNEAVEKIFKTFPDLNAMDIVNFKSPKGEYHGVSLSGLKRQARTKLSCN